LSSEKLIAFGGYPLFREKIDGISRYSYNILGALARRNPNWKFIVLGFAEHEDRTNCLPQLENIEAFFVPEKRRSYEVASLLRPKPIDHYLPTCPDFHLIPDLYTLPYLKSAKKILVVHDLVFRDFPQTMSLRNKLYLKKSVASSIRDATVVACISRFTQGRLMHYYKALLESKTLLLAPNGVDRRFFKVPTLAEQQLLREKYALPQNFYLSVGTLEPRKNLKYLTEAFLALPYEERLARPLVLVGNSGWGEVVLPDDQTIQWTGYVDDKDLPKLYHLADALLFPSKYEGFGLPPLEAMAAKIPVLSSEIASVREFAGDLIDYFSLDDMPALTKLLAQPLDSSSLEAAKERAYKLTWDNAVVQLEAYIAGAAEYNE